MKSCIRRFLSGAIAYDVVCPSDYMIQRDRKRFAGQTEPGQHSQYKNMDSIYMEQSRSFDPDNAYSVLFTVWVRWESCTTKTMVHEPVDSWDILWDSKYVTVFSCRILSGMPLL